VNCIWVLFLSAILGSILGLSMILLHKLLRGDQYDRIELPAESGGPLPWMATERDASPGADDASSAGEPGQGEPPEQLRPTETFLRVARKTSLQLHHFPFGPYIAIAAFLVMFFHGSVDRWFRDVFILL
jgi:hypothetical protein